MIRSFPSLTRSRVFMIFPLLFLVNIAYADIRHIRYEQIPGHEAHQLCFDFVLENLSYCEYWTPQWNYEIEKDSLINELQHCYTAFSAFPEENLEAQLLLGDLAHCLYNLELGEYYRVAEMHYLKALTLTPGDYRTWWFYGKMCANANQPEKSILTFSQARKLLPENTVAGFWEDFAFAAAIANMPSNALFAMDKARAILGMPSHIENQLGDIMRGRIEPMNRDSSYLYQDFWIGISGEEMSTFISRALGISLNMESDWRLEFYDYANRQSAMTFVPDPLFNTKGKEITYTIAVLFKVPQPFETLDGYVGQFATRYKNRTRIPFSDKYPGLIAYEIKDKKLYKKIGGARNYMIGIERKSPPYPGLELEQPQTVPEGKSGEKSFYRPHQLQERFGDTIFYLILLDTCGDIHDESFKVFMNLFENHLILE
jgi:tetratricopeptide (TPR) repeat protein